MASRVAVPRVERRDQSCRELEVRPLERFVDGRKVIREASLLLIEAVETLSGHGGHKEESNVHAEL